MKNKPPIISISGLHLTLGSGISRVHILKGLDLIMEEEQSVGIVGPSGSGKTTLLMVIGGLERASRGKVVISGHEPGTMSEDGLAAFRGRNIGIVFQSFHLIANMTAMENVAVPLELAGRGDAMEKAKRELAAVGLENRLAHYPAQLSGGEQQRVAIARAIAQDPRILIADEPTGNLDDATGNQIIQLLFDKQRERRMTMILVTHNSSLAQKCDRVIHMKAGRIAETRKTRKTMLQKG